MLITLATGNRHKIIEITRIIGDIGVIFKPMDGPGAVEDGKTIEENAVKKAVFATSATGGWALSDDTGLEVDYLDGAPGVYSSRFAGPGASYDDNVDKLLEMLEGIPVSRRGARFCCVAALAHASGKIETTAGYTSGIILDKRMGKGGFGYDPVFLPNGEEKTFAEMTPKEKDLLSHRAIAMTGMKNRLVTLLS